MKRYVPLIITQGIAVITFKIVICVLETTLNIAVFVKSKANYFKRRETIRSTWGRFFFVKSVRIERIFVLGQTENEADQRLIIHENKTRGDILQYDGPDDYK